MSADQDDISSRAQYSNLFRIGFNATEFLFDFGRQFEGTEERFYQRIITSPGHAKALSRLLSDSVSSYEEKYGLPGGDLRTR